MLEEEEHYEQSVNQEFLMTWPLPLRHTSPSGTSFEDSGSIDQDDIRESEYDVLADVDVTQTPNMLADAALTKSQQLMELLRSHGITDDENDSTSVPSSFPLDSKSCSPIHAAEFPETPSSMATVGKHEDFQGFERRIAELEEQLKQLRQQQNKPGDNGYYEAKLFDGFASGHLSTNSTMSTFLSGRDFGSPCSTLGGRSTRSASSQGLQQGSEAVLRELRQAMQMRWPEEAEPQADHTDQRNIDEAIAREELRVLEEEKRRRRRVQEEQRKLREKQAEERQEQDKATQECALPSQPSQPAPTSPSSGSFVASASVPMPLRSTFLPAGALAAPPQGVATAPSPTNAAPLTPRALSGGLVTPSSICRTISQNAMYPAQIPRSPKMVRHKVSVTHTYNFVTVSS
jgi:hypothetical protein